MGLKNILSVLNMPMVKSMIIFMTLNRLASPFAIT